MNDTGNTERFAEMFGENYQYNHTAKQFHRWDGVRWKPDARDKAYDDVKLIAPVILKEGMALADGDQRTAMLNWAKASGMGFHIRASVVKKPARITVRQAFGCRALQSDL